LSRSAIPGWPMSENSTRKQRHGFQPGQSGNPAGKPKGAKNLVTRAVEDLLNGEAEKLTRQAIALALTGDPTALRLCLDRIAPAPKGRRVALDLPAVSSADDLAAAFRATLEAMAAGDISPDEAATVAGILEGKRKAIETVEIERRITALEQAKDKK